MGESIDNKDFAVKEDGTIVRNRTCSKCGKVSSSGGDYCEYCGRMLPNTNPAKRLDYEKQLTSKMILLMISAILISALQAFGLAFISTLWSIATVPCNTVMIKKQDNGVWRQSYCLCYPS